jgi:hypothetical protein
MSKCATASTSESKLVGKFVSVLINEQVRVCKDEVKAWVGLGTSDGGW